MEHTKGPWKYEPETKTIRAIPSNYWLASMDSWDGAVDNEANARLIASAPELLEALREAKQILERAKQYFPKSIKNSDRFSLLNVLANSIDPVITKAEGRQ